MSMDEADILAWLNGRAVGNIEVIHKGKVHVLWTVDDARGGLTIEQAVAHFAKEHGIDVHREAEHG